jgi:DNA-binding CsgD family transcriptional regulator
LAEYASGLRVQEIADKHGRTKGAIVWALHQNKVKLGAAHLSQAVAIAIARGDLSMPTGADMQVFALAR